DRVGPPSLYQNQAGQDSGTRLGAYPILGHPPVDRRSMPEHRIDMAGELRPVLGTDVPPAAKIFGRHVVSRTIFAIDRSQDLNSGSDLRSWSQTILGSFPPAGTTKTTSQRSCG